MYKIDLTKGVAQTEQYKAFKFPGGEVHFKLNAHLIEASEDDYSITARINSSDDLILLCLAVETLKKEGAHYIEVFLPYMPYQQADRKFSDFESFSLKTITNILNSLPVDKYFVFDAHSDVTGALLDNVTVIDNSEYIKFVVNDLNDKGANNLTLLSPDAGAYKKIGKLADKIGFTGDVAAANKYRSLSTGTIESLELSKTDFEGADVLIVDDICMGGRTFIGLAEKLREKNVGKLYLAVSHGIFNNGLKELNSHFDGLYTTDSRINHLEDNDFTFLNDNQLYKLTVFSVVK